MIGLKCCASFSTNEKRNQNQSDLVRAIFSRALRKLSLQVAARNSDWFIALFAPVVIGRSYYFGFACL